MDHLFVPEVHLTDPGVQACFLAAVDNLVNINTVPCDCRQYNLTGLLDPELALMFRAGGDYQTPWTRDAAINTWNAGRLLLPRVARNTLLAVCVNNADGQPIIQPDDQKWDRVVWITGAWQYYLATGDREFLTIARGIAARGLAQLDEEWFCPDTGLYNGGSFFNDGISGYPRDIYEPGLDHSFMGNHPRTQTIQSLSTNCLYCEAWRILDRMNALLGITDPRPLERHEALKESILSHFRRPDGSGYCYLRYPDGRLDTSTELAGICFGVLFGILPADALDTLHREPWGVTSIWPPFPGISSRQRPGRHNNLIWPFLNGFLIQAAALTGRLDLAAAELRDFTRMVNGSGGFYEIYDALDGRVNGGWQIGGDDLEGHLWDSCKDQTWSATGYIGAVLQGVFGIRTMEAGVEFRPCVPEYLRDSHLRGLRIRDCRFDVTIEGWGSKLAGVYVNGQPRDAFVPFPADAGTYEVRLVMA